MKSAKFIALLMLCSAAFTVGCQKEEADSLELSVTASTTNAAVNERITFTIYHNANQLAAYNGEEGHIYRNSPSYLLNGVSQSSIDAGNEYRAIDPVSCYFELNTDHLDVGNVAGELMLYNNSTAEDVSSTSSTQALVTQIKHDPTINQNVLSLQNTGTGYNNYYVRFYPQIPLTTNKNLTFRIKGSSANIYNSTAYIPATSDYLIKFQVRLSCKVKEGTKTTNGADFTEDAAWVDAPNGLTNSSNICTYLPTTEYQDISFDLSQHIENYCSNNKITEDDIEYIDYIEFNLPSKVIDSKSYVYLDELYLADLNYSGIAYYDYSTGESITINSPDGVTTFSHTYFEPGNYEMTIVASTNSYKVNYSEVGDELGTNYDYDKSVVTIPIKVR